MHQRGMYNKGNKKQLNLNKSSIVDFKIIWNVMRSNSEGKLYIYLDIKQDFLFKFKILGRIKELCHNFNIFFLVIQHNVHHFFLDVSVFFK